MSVDPRPDGGTQRFFGLYPAIVASLVDDQGKPDSLGRIQVKFPWLGSEGEREVRAWATLLSPYADNEQGLQVLPEVDSQVVVAFEGGNPRRPYIVGSCWNGREAMPEQPDRQNNKRLFRTRSKSLLEFDDTQGNAKITISTHSGHKLLLDDGAQTITLSHAQGSTITLDAAGNVQIQANANVEVTATTLNVHAATANFDGIINCTSVNTNVAVTSPMYSPGAGNVW